MSIKVNLNGISELDFPTGVTSATTTADVTTINLSSVSSAAYTVVSKTSNYTANNGDDVWCVGTFSVTLPTNTPMTRVKVSNRGTGVITVIPPSGTINGNATMSLGTQYSSVELAGDGTNWGVE